MPIYLRAPRNAITNNAILKLNTTGGGEPEVVEEVTFDSSGNMTTAADIRTTSGVGTAETGVTAVEAGFGSLHVTKLNFTDLAIGSAVGAANLAFGKLLYTLPAGSQAIVGAVLDVALTGTVNIVADTPDVGIGTTIGSGAVAVLGGTAAFENILTGQTSGAISGSNSIAVSLNTPLYIDSSGAKTIHLNVADGWAGAGDVTATGDITLLWMTV